MHDWVVEHRAFGQAQWKLPICRWEDSGTVANCIIKLQNAPFIYSETPLIQSPMAKKKGRNNEMTILPRWP